MFPRGSVHLEIISTDITQPAGSLELFMWKTDLGQSLVKYVEDISRKDWKLQNTFKNSMDIFLFPMKEIQIFSIFD